MANGFEFVDAISVITDIVVILAAVGGVLLVILNGVRRAWQDRVQPMLARFGVPVALVLILMVAGLFVRELSALKREVADLARLQELSSGYSVRFFNADDVMTLLVNGSTALECGWHPDSCYFAPADFARVLRPGDNEVAVLLRNFVGPTAYGYEIRRNGILLYAKSCGFVGTGTEVQSCEESPIHNRDGTEELLKFTIVVR